jgi:hypothetical protein
MVDLGSLFLFLQILPSRNKLRLSAFLEINHIALLEIFEWCALFGKVHSLSVAPEPLAVLEQRVGGSSL